MSVIFYRNVLVQNREGAEKRETQPKVTQKQQLTLSFSWSQSFHLKAIWLYAKDCLEEPDNKKVSFIVKDSYTLKMTLKRG